MKEGMKANDVGIGRTKRTIKEEPIVKMMMVVVVVDVLVLVVC